MVCPTCNGVYADYNDHIRKKHPDERYTALQLQPLGLTPCPICKTACKNDLGVKTHLSKIHKISGASKISTQPRIRTENTDNTNSVPTSSFNPVLPEIQTLTPGLNNSRWADNPRKRRADTPSPTRGRNTRPRRFSYTDIDLTNDEPADNPRANNPRVNNPRVNNEPPSSPNSLPSISEFHTPGTLPLTNSNISLKDQHDKITGPILQKPLIQKLIEYSKIPIPEHHLHARQAKIFADAANRIAKNFIQSPTEKTLFNLLILPRIFGIGLINGKVTKIMQNFPSQIPPIPKIDFPSEKTDSDPVLNAKKLLEKGYIGRAAKAIIDPTPVAPETPESLNILREKHPIGQNNPFNTKSQPISGRQITEKAILLAISSIGREKAPGLSGWTRSLLDAAIKIPTQNDVIPALRLLTDMIRQGTAPGRELLCASRLIGLSKPDGGVRPIAVGDLLYKIAFKAILNTLWSPNCLLPYQLGVNSIGGVEPAIFTLEEAIMGPNINGIKSITSLDLKNAFNSVSRAAIASSVAKYAPTFYRSTCWAYNQPSILITENGSVLASAQGIRQGDPLGPLLFSLAFRPTLETIQKSLPYTYIAAYLDDVYILSKTPVKDKIAKIIEKSPFTLNSAKTTETDIDTLKTNGLKTLGSFIGPTELRKEFLQNKIQNFESSINALKKLPKQYGLLILRKSTQLLLRHLLRTLNSQDLWELWEKTDKLIADFVINLTVTKRKKRPITDFVTPLITLPIKDGGFGLLRHNGIAQDIYFAAKDLTTEIRHKIQRISNDFPQNQSPTATEILHLLHNGVLADCKNGLTNAQLNALTENASYLGRKWLNILPIQKSNRLTDWEMAEAVRLRLLAPVKPLTHPCNHCGNRTNINHEDVCKGAVRKYTARHDQINRSFVNSLKSRPEIDVEIEPDLNNENNVNNANTTTENPTPSPNGQNDTGCLFTTPIRSGTRNGQNGLRADFAVINGVSKYYYDVQIVAINKDSGNTNPLNTLADAANNKRRKYQFLDPFFHPIIISAGGLMEKDTAQAYKQIQKLIGPVAAHWLDTSISLILLRSRTTAAISIAKNRPRA
uniref:Reverse transcriptase n=1 Tax=Pyricularia oryzae TaxID=318829 RepID=I1VC87_PYROR|nr:reverse transcriptase [Pyricularia oryzae]AFI41157.1 reverse transcriptase [Pyricularia oryzae]AFI41158.1 reverse transcriptase [Pyricularia oryzae]